MGVLRSRRRIGIPFTNNRFSNLLWAWRGSSGSRASLRLQANGGSTTDWCSWEESAGLYQKKKKKKRGGAPQPSVKAHPLPWSSCPRFEPDVKECYSVVAGSSLANDDRIREDPRWPAPLTRQTAQARWQAAALEGRRPLGLKPCLDGRESSC